MKNHTINTVIAGIVGAISSRFIFGLLGWGGGSLFGMVAGVALYRLGSRASARSMSRPGDASRPVPRRAASHR